MTEGLVACRGCGTALERVFADLGETPLANGLVSRERLAAGPAPRYPLRVMVCDACHLVQLDRDLPPAAMFSDYLYFSSYSASWLAHARAYCAAITARLGLGAASRVVEIASNDGYLLKEFVAHGIPCLGVEPAANVAEVAVAAGVPTVVAYFGLELAERLLGEIGPADLVVTNNVLAHVPDPHDFVGGIARLLAPAGTWTVEFPHLLRLIAETQFDTIYHEHVFYLSLTALRPILARHGLVAVDVDELPTHGGSLRLYIRHAAAAAADGEGEGTPALAAVDAAERAACLDGAAGYDGFQRRVERVCQALRQFLDEARRAGLRVAAYGAAAKGATLLDVANVTRADLLYVCDRSPHKQGLVLPGTGLPIVPPERLRLDRPARVLVLPWNLADEIADEIAFIGDWGGSLVRAIPELRVWAPPR